VTAAGLILGANLLDTDLIVLAILPVIPASVWLAIVSLGFGITTLRWSLAVQPGGRRMKATDYWTLAGASAAMLIGVAIACATLWAMLWPHSF